MRFSLEVFPPRTADGFGALAQPPMLTAIRTAAASKPPVVEIRLPA